MTTEALAKDRMSKEKLYIKAQEALRVCTESERVGRGTTKLGKERKSEESESEQREKE
jgi:hypothetical protein